MIVLNKLEDNQRLYSAMLSDEELRMYSIFGFFKSAEEKAADAVKKRGEWYERNGGFTDEIKKGLEEQEKKRRGLSFDQGKIDRLANINDAAGRGLNPPKSGGGGYYSPKKVSKGLGKKILKYGGGAAVLGGAAYGGYKYLQGRKQKSYTRYDDSDILKQTKDSDILAEQKRSNTGSYLGALGTAATGAAAGATIGGTVGAFRGLRRGGKGFIGGMKSGGAKGALALGAISGVAALAAGRKQREDNRFYNKRLAYAQQQARRREQRDWKNNMTNRVSYTY